MIASPDSKPRRPSSQLTLAPSRVQDCAIADPLPAAVIADTRIENTSARSMVMPLSVGWVVAIVNRRP
jgi:hypothetical protein